MSSSSTTACSRSPSPSTPEGSDNLDPAITQEVVDAWCHSLSQDGFCIPDEPFDSADKEGRAPTLDLGDLIQDDAYEEYVASIVSVNDRAHKTRRRVSFHPSCFTHSSPSNTDMHPSVVGARSQSFSYTMAEGRQTFKARAPISATKPVPPPPSQVRRDPPPTAMQSVVYPPKESCSKCVFSLINYYCVSIPCPQSTNHVSVHPRGRH